MVAMSEQQEPIQKSNPPMMESRKFKALVMAIAVYGIPVVMVFVLVLTKNATKDDLVSMTKWMGLSLSPAFLGYIGSVALEDYGRSRTE